MVDKKRTIIFTAHPRECREILSEIAKMVNTPTSERPVLEGCSYPLDNEDIVIFAIASVMQKTDSRFDDVFKFPNKYTSGTNWGESNYYYTIEGEILRNALEIESVELEIEEKKK